MATKPKTAKEKATAAVPYPVRIHSRTPELKNAAGGKR